jgi:hypothetical protein
VLMDSPTLRLIRNTRPLMPEFLDQHPQAGINLKTQTNLAPQV